MANLSKRKNLVKSTIPFGRALGNAAVIDADTAGLITVPTPEKGYALHLYSFYLNSDRYTKGSLEVSGAGTFEVFVNNKPVGATSELALEPHRYEVVIKYLTADTDTCPSTLTAKFKSEEEAKVIASLDPEKRYTPRDILEGTQFRGTSVSPDGKYVLVKYYTRMEGGKSEQYAQLRDAATGRILLQDKGFILTADWMPTSSKMYFTRTGMNGKELVTVDPATMQEEILAENLPEGSFSFTPDEKTLLYTIQEEGPKDGPDMLRILEPNDRLPGFRNRYLIWRYDLQTGLYEQLTYGHNNTFINDVSADSRYLLFSTNEQDYTSLPHSSNSMYKLDLQSMAVDTLWERAKYINGATFSPDGKRLMVFGSGNAFDNIGLNIKEGPDIQHLRRTAFPVRSGNAESESAYQRLQPERHKCTMEQIRRTDLYVDGRPGLPACLYLQSGQRENPPPRPAGRRHLQLLASRSRSGHVLLRTERIQRQPPVQLQHQE